MIFLLASYLIAVAFAAITITNHQDIGNYYLRFTLSDIDGSSCGNSISSVSIYVNSNWKSANQKYGNDYAWEFSYAGSIKFGDMLPISIRISTSQRDITLWGIVTNINKGKSWSTDESMCDGSPTDPPTPKPVVAPTPPTTPFPTSQSVCISKDPDSIQWRSKDNQIYLNGNRFNMKGLSWFGFETGNYNLYGLDYHNQDWYFQWMRDNGFNAMRLPFSADFINGGSGNRNLYKAAVQKAGEYGIFVMLDMHSKTAGSWTDGLYTISQSQAISTWELMADLLKDEYNVFMADIFNEPHDVSNSQWGEWVQFCEDVAAALWAKGVNWLIAVEGTNWQCSVLNCAWGENLEGIRDTGITFDLETHGSDRLILSPHVYGADVTGNPYSTAGWKAHWGYLADGSYPQNEAAVVIGEFGTRYQGNMVNWLDDLVKYLVSIDQRNHFFWCLNPNSGDTGGLLKDDWTTPEDGKLTQLDKLQETPSKVTVQSNKICVSNLGDPRSLGASSFTESDNDSNSTLEWPIIAGIVVFSFLCIGCIVGGCIYYKRKNRGQAEFKETAPDTPEPAKETDEDEDNAEIEVEMNVADEDIDGQTVTTTTTQD